MDMMELIRPEMLTLIPVLYLMGMALKRAEVFANKYIPLGLGLLGALLGAAWLLVFRDAEYNTMQSLLMGAVQGILCAGCSVYANQIYKQLKEMQEAIDKLQDQLKVEQDRYISQFTTMESLINQMNTQSRKNRN